MMLSIIAIIAAALTIVAGFQHFPSHASKISKTAVYYDYFKKNPDGTKKELGRIWKNIIFPGIYYEYADTKEAPKTIKVTVKDKDEPQRKTTSRNGDEPFFSDQPKSGTYNMMDPKSAPSYESTVVLKTALKPVRKPADFVAPQPKKSVANGAGPSVLPNISSYPRNTKPIVIYECEALPDSKKVREACTMLDLVVEYRPCPGKAGYSDNMATVSGGRRDVPFMIDEGGKMVKPRIFGATEIVKYLYDAYGPGDDKVPKNLQGGTAIATGNAKGAKIRPNARPDCAKMKPITLYGWEGAQYVKQVREVLSELGLSHIMINCSKGSNNRSKLMAKTGGVFQVPYISDPNTGVEMFESAEIIKYLEKVYTV